MSGINADVTAGATPTSTATPEPSYDINAMSDSLGSDLLSGLGLTPRQERTPKPVPADPALDKPEETNLDGGTPAPATPPAGTPDSATPPAGTPAPTAKVVPGTWRPEAQQAWDTLPDVVKDEVLKREQDMFAGLEQYKADAAQGQSFSEALKPFEQIFQTYGIDPAKQVAGLMNAHLTLSMGSPEQKQALINQLVKDYGLYNLQVDSPYVDPTVASLQTEVKNLRMALDAQQSQTSREMESKINAEVAAFAADPKNVHFNAVFQDMAQLLQSGVSKSLQDAYDKAVWANPVTREAVMKAQHEAERQEQARIAEEARKKTGVKVKATGSGGTATIGTMDDTLAETLAAIQSRSN